MGPNCITNLSFHHHKSRLLCEQGLSPAPVLSLLFQKKKIWDLKAHKLWFPILPGSGSMKFYTASPISSASIPTSIQNPEISADDTKSLPLTPQSRGAASLPKSQQEPI